MFIKSYQRKLNRISKDYKKHMLDIEQDHHQKMVRLEYEFAELSFDASSDAEKAAIKAAAFSEFNNQCLEQEKRFFHVLADRTRYVNAMIAENEEMELIGDQLDILSGEALNKLHHQNLKTINKFMNHKTK